MNRPFRSLGLLFCSLLGAACTTFGSTRADDLSPIQGTPDEGITLIVKADASPLSVIEGRAVVVNVLLVRRPSSVGPFVVRASGLPAGASADAARFAAGATQATMTIVTADGSPQGPTTIHFEAKPDDEGTQSPMATADLPAFVRGKPGALDTTFATAGIVPSLYGSGVGDPVWATTLADGSVLTSGAKLVKLTNAGAFDAAFGSGGSAPAPIGPFDTLADGRIYGIAESPTDVRPMLYRYLPNGAVDTSFGMNGAGNVEVETGLGGSKGLRATALADGKALVLALYTSVAVPDQFLAISRWNADGTLDTTYGNGGTDVGYCRILTAYATGGTMIVRPDGSAVALASVGNTTVARGCTSTGDVDVRIGIGPGYTQTVATGTLVHAEPYGDGFVFAFMHARSATETYAAYSVASAAAVIDTTIGVAGIVDSFLGAGAWITTQADGKILVGGASGEQANANWTIARHQVDGSIDTAFGDDGIVRLAFGDPKTSQSQLANVLVAPDGRIVAVGSRFDSNDGAVARFWP